MRKATDFFKSIAEECDWTPSQLSKRLFEVKLEMSASGTYQHTAEELQLGARLAWRNSVKVSLMLLYDGLCVAVLRVLIVLTSIVSLLDFINLSASGASPGIRLKFAIVVTSRHQKVSFMRLRDT